MIHPVGSWVVAHPADNVILQRRQSHYLVEVALSA